MIDPNASDWSDLDLLTKAEATERLTEEIAVIDRQLEDLTGDLGDAARQRLERRLTLLRRRFDH